MFTTQSLTERFPHHTFVYNYDDVHEELGFCRVIPSLAYDVHAVCLVCLPTDPHVKFGVFCSNDHTPSLPGSQWYPLTQLEDLGIKYLWKDEDRPTWWRHDNPCYQE